MLEKVVVQVSLEPPAEGDAAGLPSHGVGELQGAAHHQRLRALRRQVHLDDLQPDESRLHLRIRDGGCPNGSLMLWAILGSEQGWIQVRGCSDGHGQGRGFAADPILIVVDVEGLVRVNIDVVVVLRLLRRRPHESPNRQVIDEQLIPAMTGSGPGLLTVRVSDRTGGPRLLPCRRQDSG